MDRGLPWLVLVWGVGVVGFGWRWLQGCFWVRRIQRVGTAELQEPFLTTLERLKDRLGISRPVRLLRSCLVEVPVVVGWLRPVILLPASILSDLTPAELQVILAHELVHVRRLDYLVNTFQNLIETTMFYHPAVWWISRCVREEREHGCDDLVVQLCGNRLAYVCIFQTEDVNVSVGQSCRK